MRAADAKRAGRDLKDAPPAATLAAMITLDRISVEFPGGLCAVDGVSLRLEPGTFTVLLGRSGSGKSTLLRCCNGLQAATAGTVAMDGLGVAADRAAWRALRRRTAMVFQSHQLLPRWSAFANALVGSLGRRPLLAALLLPVPLAAAEAALDALARVGLAERAQARVDRLSGGERQRVGIARALVQRPALVLADEPVASLDPATAIQVLDLLRTVCRQDRLTALVSLHQVELARRLADRVVALAHGRLVFDGPPSELSDEVETGIYRAARQHPLPTPAGEPALIGA
jgi:phosphonate transport system ATP-binding protein